MQIVLLDQVEIFKQLLPFTYTRPIGAIRVGITTLAEKWEFLFKAKIGYCTTDYLQQKYPKLVSNENLVIASHVVASETLKTKIESLNIGQVLLQKDHFIAARVRESDMERLIKNDFHSLKVVEYHEQLTLIEHPWHIFQYNGDLIRQDFEWLTRDRKSETITDLHTRTYNMSNIFIESGVDIKASILNAESGPIYLGKNSVVQEGAIIKGPFALGEGSHINMGAKIRGDVTVGPYCKVGGEVSNTVFFGFSNKGHDGFLGNSVIGEWCNLGADTNSSNLKNNYANVKVWSYVKNKFVDTGLQFCGLLMGDHSKTGINTMLNTGTVVGVSANIFGDGFPRTLIPSFSWGGAAGFTTYKLDKSEEVAAAVMARRGKILSKVDKKILAEVFEATSKYRIWEKKAS